MQQFDDILLKIGQIGWYQFALALLISLHEVNSCWSMLVLIFIGADPGWTCSENVQNGNTTTSGPQLFSTLKTLDISNGSDTFSAENNSQCGMCSNYDFNTEFTSIVTEWDLVCDNDFISDTISSLQMAGVLAGCLLFGQIGDTLGRKKAYFAAILLTSSMALGQYFTTAWYQFAVLRFFNGIGIGGCLVTGFTWSIEFLGPKYRPVVIVLGIWPMASLIFLAIAYFIRDWRTVQLITPFPGFLLLGTWWVLPESPRWLLSRGRYDEVVTIATRIAKRNNKKLPDMDLFIKQHEKERAMENHETRFGFWDLFRSPDLTVVTLKNMFVWFSMSLFNYGVFFNLKNLPGDRYTNMAINFGVSYASAVISYLSLRRFGRRIITTVGLFFGFICVIPIFTLFLLGLYAQLWLVISILTSLATTAVSVGWYALYILTSEQYPTPIRNIGLGFSSMTARIAAILAPLMAYLTKYWDAFPFVLSGTFALLSGVVTIFMEETRDKPLEDTVPEKQWCFCGQQKVDVGVKTDNDISLNDIGANYI
ncbi:organic cation transporter protein [Lingula anatina]|uniref:Organic cation transporter protein n=1 Tax=Lingula anatina TaxID=7574 RepID=A0A1S3KF62_LINAN|nr:organic cation transporter protein [Lingula anatina]|eukprot:XP_013421094.1 organic cation transporter protein [Lingula anatina]